MKARNLTVQIRSAFLDSLRFEADKVFRNQMGRLVNRNMMIIGYLGVIALVLFVLGQGPFLGRQLTFSYPDLDPRGVTVLWDKLAILLVFGAILGFRHFVPDTRPNRGRLAMTLAAMAIVFCMTADDVIMGDVEFSPAYVTMVVLFLASAVPMPPAAFLVSAVLSIGSWGLTLTIFPWLTGMNMPPLHGNHVVFLSVIAIIGTAASSLLYKTRYEEYRSRRRAEDLSKQLVKTNKSLEQALHDLTEAQDRLVYVEKMASLGRFASGVAHEIRNPLNFVMNFSDLSFDLLDDSEAALASGDIEELKGNLRKIHEHASRAERIVKSMIAYAQPRSATPSDVDINELLRKRVSSVSQRFVDSQAGAPTQVVLELAEHAGVIEAYPYDLTDAIDHVLDNAFRATVDRAFQSEDDYQPLITVSTQRVPHGVQITIGDNGVGMSDADAHLAFEPFFTKRPAGSGTGLGLASAYTTITEGHGGKVTLSSELGRGSVVTIVLTDAPGDSQENADG